MRNPTSPPRTWSAWRSIPRWSRSARPGSTITTISARATPRRPAFAGTSPRRARPGCRSSSTPAKPTPISRRILEEETGKGAFPAVLHCFTGGRELALRAIALGLYVSFTGILTFKKSDELRAIAAELPADRILVETDAPYLAPGKYPRQAQRAGLCDRDRQGARRHARRLGRGDRAPRPPRTSSACSTKVPRLSAAAGMTLRGHHPRLRLFRRRAAARPRLGRLRPQQSEEPAAALLDPGRAHGRQMASRTRVLVDTSPDLREQLLDARRRLARRRAATPMSMPTTSTASTICAALFIAPHAAASMSMSTSRPGGCCRTASAIAS